MNKLIKYFLVGAGVFGVVIAFVAIMAGVVFGVEYGVDKHPFIGKIIADILISIVVICFLTAYGWIICD